VHSAGRRADLPACTWVEGWNPMVSDRHAYAVAARERLGTAASSRSPACMSWLLGVLVRASAAVRADQPRLLQSHRNKNCNIDSILVLRALSSRAAPWPARRGTRPARPGRRAGPRAPPRARAARPPTAPPPPPARPDARARRVAVRGTPSVLHTAHARHRAKKAHDQL